MAENNMFGYTASQSVVQPTTPNISVRPNMQASKAFTSLSSLLKTGAEVVAQESETAKKEAQSREYVDTNNTAVAMFTQNEKDVAAAGSDLDKLALAHNNYSEGLQNLLNNTTLATQERVVGTIGSLKKRAASVFEEDSKRIKLTNLDNDIHSFAATYSLHTSEEQTLLFNEFKALSEDLGVNPKEFGKAFSGAIINTTLTAIDEEAMVNNLDYAALNQLQANIKSLEKLDPRNTDGIKAASEVYDKSKDLIDSALRSRISLSIQAGEEESFLNNSKKAVDNGAISKEEFELNKKRFAAKTLTKVSNVDSFIQNISQNGLVLPTTTLQKDYETKTTKLYTDTLRSIFNAGSYEDNFTYLQKMQQINPQIYTKEISNYLNTGINTLKGLASKGATKEELQGALTGVDKMYQFSFDKADVATRLNLSVMRTLINTDQVKNIPTALEILNSSGEVTMLSANNSIIKDINNGDSIPRSQREEAKRTASALSGLFSEAQVKDLIKEQFGYQEQEKVKVSNATLSFINNSSFGGTITENATTKLVTVLTNPSVVSPETAEAVTAVLNGEEPVIDIVANTLIIGNANQEQKRIALDPQTISLIKQSMAAAAVNSPDQLDVLVYEGMDKLADRFTKIGFSETADIVEGVIATPAYGVKTFTNITGNAAMAVSELFSNTRKDLNEVIADVKKGNLTAAQALFKFTQKEEAVISKYARLTSKENSQAYKEYMESLDKIDTATITIENSAEALGLHIKNSFEEMSKAMRALNQSTVN